jgi:hypothetical protein
MTKLTVTEISSAVITQEQLNTAVREGRVLDLYELGYVIAPKAAIVELADEIAEEELLEEMVSYRKNVTGVDNTIFISPKGNTRHAARVKLAINPPDSINPRGGEMASIAIHDGALVAGEVSPDLLKQVRRFIDENRDALIDYWEYQIDTDKLRERLKSIEAGKAAFATDPIFPGKTK